MTKPERRTWGAARAEEACRPSARARRLLRGYLGDAGATAVEFALVASLFFIWVFVVLQMCLLIFMSQALQTATVKAGRLYMTGNATTITSPATFEPLVCQNLPSFFNCKNLVVNLQTASSAANLGNNETPMSYKDPCTTTKGVTTCTPEVCNSGGSCSNGSYNASTPDQYAILQVYYPAPLIGNGFNFGNIIVGTTVFQVEPYPTNGS